MAISKSKKTKYYCHRCGAELTDENSRPVSSEYSQTGYSHLCVDCEQEYFDMIASVCGNSIALYVCCAAYCVPCLPTVVKDLNFQTEEGAWITYLNALGEKGLAVKNEDEIATFFDGEVDILRIFGKNCSEKDFAKYLQAENEYGTFAQRKQWGTRPIFKDIKMTAQVYNDLDRQYEIRKNSYSGQTLTEQQENTLRNVAINNVIYSYCMSQGLVKHAIDVQKITDSMLASEQMRKKDEKPVEGYELMSQVVALERAGCMENGQFLPIDKLQEAIYKKFIKRKKYAYTLDACDEFIERSYNTTRQNADLFVVDVLPDELEVEDTFEEFADEESDEEKAAKRYINFTPVSFEHNQQPSIKKEEDE